MAKISTFSFLLIASWMSAYDIYNMAYDIFFDTPAAKQTEEVIGKRAILPAQYCTGAANTIAGTVYEDWNYDGNMNESDTLGVEGVQVDIYDTGNALVNTSFTDADGNYEFTGLTGTDYRIEFVLPGSVSSWAQPTQAGTDNGTTVQFVQPGNCASLGLGQIVTCPSGALLETYNLIMSCGTRSDYSSNQQYTLGIANVKPLSYNPTVITPTDYHHPAWVLDSIGNIGHLAFDNSGNIYAAATVFMGSPWQNWQNVGWRFGDIGGGADAPSAGGTIYKIDALTGQPTVFAQLPQQQTTIKVDTDFLNSSMLTRTASPGLFGISYDEDHQQLFAANVEDGKIYRINASGSWVASQAYDPANPDDGSAGWASRNGEMVTAVEYYKHRLYYAIRNDAIINNVNIRSIGINADGSFNLSDDRPEIDAAQHNNDYSYVRDIEFSYEGKMAVGNMGMNSISSNDTILTFTLLNHVATNSIWEYNRTSGQWIKIVNYDPSVKDNISVESYGGIDWGNYQGLKHELLWTSAADINENSGGLTNDIHGVIGFEASALPNNPTQTGSGNYMYMEYPASAGTDPKGVGGDVESFNNCDCILPIEIGNYVWEDTNGDGLQDAYESGTDGIVIELLSGSTAIATTTTANGGQYYFSNKNASDPNLTWTGTGVDTTLLSNTAYTIRISNATGGSQQVALANNSLTIQNANSNNSDLVDSDAVANGTSAEISVTTGGNGKVNHSVDFGFTLACEITIDTTFATNCSGTDPFTADWNISILVNGNPDTDISYKRNNNTTANHVLTGTTDTLTIIGIPADGGIYDTLTVWFTNDITCADTVITKRPVPCPSPITLVSNCTGNADILIDSYNTIDDYKATGSPNFEGAVIGSSAPTAFILVDLVDVLLSGEAITMTWAAAASGLEATVEVSLDGASFTTVLGSPFNNTSIDINAPDNQVITLPVDTRYIKVLNASGGTIFIDGFSYTNINCAGEVSPGEICPSIPNTEISGTVFDDPNFDGIMNGVDTVGMQGIMVTLTDCNNNLLATTYTDANGNYTFPSLTPGTDYRIEFILPESISCTHKETKAGSDSGTNVQFVQPGQCASLGIGNPEEYCP